MSPKPHIYFIPVMAPGHMIPMVDLARQVSRHGAKSTIVTTPLNASQFCQTIDRDRQQGSDITVSLIEFPCQESGLPAGCESLSSTTTPDTMDSFFRAMDLLQQPVESLLQEGDPDCVVAGAFFWWATDVACRLGIPRLVFYGTGCFPMCVYECLMEHKPYEKVGSDGEEFIVPGLPDEIRLSRRQLPDSFTAGDDNNPFAEMQKKIVQAESSSHGLIVNTFDELEPDYVKLYPGLVGIKTWNVGPISLFNNNTEDKAHRGKEASVTDHQDCLNWLNSKKPNSVVYICFGSMAIFAPSQLSEIARGLEASGQEFIWVVGEKVEDMQWLSEGFESRLSGRGLIIRGWAPQVLILEHAAVGGFITHCGWNSLLEGVVAGVPMVTWPLSAEQFFNEKLAVDVLKIGIPVGAREWAKRMQEREPVKGENVGKAVERLMGEEGQELRIRARELAEMATRAVGNGGSSDIELRRLVEEIRAYRS